MQEVQRESITLMKVRLTFEELFTNSEETDEIRLRADTKEDFNFIVDYIF